MGPFALAWLVGEGIIIWRSVKTQKAPPGPGQLLLSSGLFITLAILAESESARPLAISLAWGFDIAAFLNLWQVGVGKIGEGSWPPPFAPNTIVFPKGNGTGSGSGGGTTDKSQPASSGSSNPVIQV